MRSKLPLLLFSLLLLSSIFIRPVGAIECGDAIPTGSDQLNEYIAKCNQSIYAARGEQQTLKAAITVLSAKINLVSAQVRQTIAQIDQLEKDVTTLSTVVSDLDKSLNDLTKVFLARVRESYMRRDPDPMILLASSDSFTKFFTRIRYLSIVKARDELILSEMTTAKVSYDNQKQAKKIKKKKKQKPKKNTT